MSGCISLYRLLEIQVRFCFGRRINKFQLLVQHLVVSTLSSLAVTVMIVMNRLKNKGKHMYTLYRQQEFQFLLVMRAVKVQVRQQRQGTVVGSVSRRGMEQGSDAYSLHEY